MSFDPYLHFQGSCRAAMECYVNVFGGSLEMTPYAMAPDASPEMAASDLIMHATLRVGGRVLLASDYPPGLAGDPQAGCSVSHIAATRAEAAQIFAALGADGTVIMPFADTFWADGFGMLKDRFGTHWMISGPWQS